MVRTFTSLLAIALLLGTSMAAAPSAFAQTRDCPNPDNPKCPTITPTPVPEEPLPTITPTPTNTTVPTATPTRTSTPTATATPTSTHTPQPTPTTATGPAPVQPASPSATASNTAAPSATATRTSTPAPTPTQRPAAAGQTTPPVASPSAVRRVETLSGLPEPLSAIPGPRAFSTKGSDLLTNAVLAGMTIWVLFSTVLLNQMLEDRRSYLDERFASLRRLLRAGWLSARGHHPSVVRRTLEIAAALIVISLVYAFLQPTVSLDRATAIMLIAALIGSAMMTLASGSMEAVANHRLAGARAAVRAYPIALVVAVISVILSRLLGLNPGIMYGSVASCIALTELSLTRRDEGRVAAVPLTAGLLLALVSWGLLAVFHHLGEGGFIALVTQATLIVMFIEGVEGCVFSLVPISMTSGGKLYRWSRAYWLVLAAVSGFAAWHILFTADERSYFSGLREVSTFVLLCVFVVYTSIIAGVYLWFRRTKAAESAAEAAA